MSVVVWGQRLWPAINDSPETNPNRREFSREGFWNEFHRSITRPGRSHKTSLPFFALSSFFTADFPLARENSSFSTVFFLCYYAIMLFLHLFSSTWDANMLLKWVLLSWWGEIHREINSGTSFCWKTVKSFSTRVRDFLHSKIHFSRLIRHFCC